MPTMRFLPRALALASLLATATACSRLDPGKVSGEVKMLVLAYDAGTNGGEYRLVIARVTTLHDLRTMDGDAAKILGGAEIVVDFDQLAKENPQTADEVARLTTRTAGRPVDFAYFEVDGVIHPEDFHSLDIATTYYNFEKAHLFFSDVNAALYNMPVQYLAKVSEGPAAHLARLTDNAFYDTITRQFLVLPFRDVKELPLGMNVGVVAHEYTHAVFANRFYKQDGIPWLAHKLWAEPDKYARAANLEKSVNEGLADLFGALVSGDPSFMRKSMSTITDTRRLDPDQPRCYTAELKQHLEGDAAAAYDPYPVGSVLASALWATVADAGDRQTQYAGGVVDGMLELGSRFQQKDADVTLADAVDAVAGTLIGDLKPKACGLLLDRFHLTAAQVPTCTEVRPPERSCH